MYLWYTYSISLWSYWSDG